MFYDYTSGTSTDDWNFARPFYAHTLDIRIRLASEAAPNNAYRHHRQETKLKLLPTSRIALACEKIDRVWTLHNVLSIVQLSGDPIFRKIGFGRLFRLRFRNHTFPKGSHQLKSLFQHLLLFDKQPDCSGVFRRRIQLLYGVLKGYESEFGPVVDQV